MVYYDDTALIKQRFFQAIDELINLRRLRGKRSFATMYELNQRNFYQLRNEETWAIEPAYLTWLVRDFAISARWLLTGEGTMFAAGRPLPDIQKNRPHTRRTRQPSASQKTDSL